MARAIGQFEIRACESERAHKGLPHRGGVAEYCGGEAVFERLESRAIQPQLETLQR